MIAASTSAIQKVKPPGAPEGRDDGELNRRILGAPDAVVVRRHNSERVGAGSHRTVVSHAPLFCVHPIPVIAFQLVLETHFLRRGKAQAGVMYFKVALSGSHCN